MDLQLVYLSRDHLGGMVMFAICKRDSEMKEKVKTYQMSKFDQDSDGVISTLYDDKLLLS